MDTLTREELRRIRGRIECVYEVVLGRYDDSKYPEGPYQQMVSVFSKRELANGEIENAMKWKWGHWGKNNYPEHHKKLVEKIKRVWPVYIAEGCITPCETFYYWRRKLEKRHRYISVAFITHLVHPGTVPIIDQHNYRAMMFLLRVAGRETGNKKKPSNWNDILNMGIFLSSLCRHLKKPVREVDKFLMMYGRYCVPR